VELCAVLTVIGSATIIGSDENCYGIEKGKLGK
jgi:hypothetical protein